MEEFGKIVWSFILGALITIIYGWVFMTVFNWLAVPLFEVAPLTLIQAIVIRFLWGVVSPSTYDKKKHLETIEEKNLLDDSQIIGYLFIKLVVFPLLILLMGWLISLFI